MKKLAKDKMLRALSNVAYAKGDYEKAMGQALSLIHISSAAQGKMSAPFTLVSPSACSCSAEHFLQTMAAKTVSFTACPWASLRCADGDGRCGGLLPGYHFSRLFCYTMS